MKKSERKWPNTDITEIDWLINVVTNSYNNSACWAFRAEDSYRVATFDPGLCAQVPCCECALDGEEGLAEWLGISVEELEKCRKKE